jgi:hypothetical protein
MTDQRLRANLQRLPDGRAGEGFTQAVLARVDELERRRQRPAGLPRWLTPPRLMTAAVAAAAVLAAALLLPAMAPPATPPSAAASAPQSAPAAGPARSLPSAASPAAATSGSDSAADLGAPEVHLAAVPAADAAGVDAAAVDEPTAGSPAGEQIAAARTGATGSDQLGGPTARPATRPADVDRRDLARRVAELRRERARLAEQLAALDASVPAERPALLLAGDESVELVLDVGAAQAQRGGGTRPAGYRPDNRPRLY